MPKFEIGKRYRNPTGVVEILKRTKKRIYFRQGAFFYGWREIKMFNDAECFELGGNKHGFVCANNEVKEA